MAETVVPVAEPFGAVSVGGEAVQEVADVFLGGGHEEGPLVAVLDRRGRRDGHARQADGVPVVRRREPPHPRLAVPYHARKRLERAPVSSLVQPGAGRPSRASGPASSRWSPVSRRRPRRPGRSRWSCPGNWPACRRGPARASSSPAKHASSAFSMAGRNRPSFSRHSASTSVARRLRRSESFRW